MDSQMGKFDSSPNFNPLLAPGQTFEHTLTEASEYPYFCLLHPNMVGTVQEGLACYNDTDELSLSLPIWDNPRKIVWTLYCLAVSVFIL
jgi:hypothetical protein